MQKVRRRNVGEASTYATGSTPKPGCPGCTRAGWKVFMQVFAIVIALLAIIVVGISVFVGANSNAIQRYNVYATSAQVTPGVGINVSTALLYGYLQTDASQDTMYFVFYYVNLPMLDRIAVRGPMDPLTRSDAPPNDSGFYLCGEVSPACTPNTGGYLNATLTTVVLEGGAVKDPYSYILDLRANPQLYYLDVYTADSPTEPSVRSYFTSITGTA